MPSESFEHVLGAHPFFEGLAPAYLAAVAGCAANVRFDAGEYLCREGEPAARFYLVRFGRVAVETVAPASNPVTVETVEEGEVLGWSWLFPPYRSHFDARATTLVRALAFDGACLRTKCEQDPALGFEVLRRFSRVVVQRLESTQMQLMDLYANRP